LIDTARRDDCRVVGPQTDVARIATSIHMLLDLVVIGVVVRLLTTAAKTGVEGFWDTIDELIQEEPPSGGDPELLGMLARLGIVHGKPFKAPTARPTSTSGPPRPRARPTTGSRPSPARGWFILLRLYSPEASFFDKTWRPTEIEPI
jgi:hypothetical protein